MTDWSAGTYELTAERLAPAATTAASHLAPGPGVRVIDVACGTGNAALDAARAGASVLGVDRAERLVAVARERAAQEGLDARFEVGDAVELPAEDGAFDAAVSVFGVIFADAPAAVAELRRVVRPGGRIVLTTWTTEGPTARTMEIVGEALGAPRKPPVWSDPEVVRSLFAGAQVAVAEHELRFRAASADAYMAEQQRDHPMWIAMGPALEAGGRAEETLARVRAVLEEAGDGPSGFDLPAPYLVVTVDLP